MLVLTVLVPLVWGIAQVGFVLHVRNVTTAAASEGARAAAALGATPGMGADRSRDLIRSALNDGFADDVQARYLVTDGLPMAEVSVRVRVPALGPFGPAVEFEVDGHAVREVAP